MPTVLKAFAGFAALPAALWVAAVYFGAAVVLAVSIFIDKGWNWPALAILGFAVDLHFFDAAWPLPELNSMPKLMLVDTALYGFLVIPPLDGIGYDFRARWSDWRTGLREFAFFAPIAAALGFAPQFLHFHASFTGARGASKNSYRRIATYSLGQTGQYSSTPFNRTCERRWA